MNRMKLWRSKKMFQEAGRQTQVCVWTSEQDIDFTREICSRVAEPTERGRMLRTNLCEQLNRRRTTFAVWLGGGEWKTEIDWPLIGPWWSLRHIGGRVLGPDGTHIELSPEEAQSLMNRLQIACQKEMEDWVNKEESYGTVSDHTGVIITPQEDKFSGGDALFTGRPNDDREFAANEAKIARSELNAAMADRKPPFEDSSVFEYEGLYGFPSFCQIAHRHYRGRVQFALIHMPNGGTSPTNMITSLTTLLRQHFYPELDPGLIDWFDVIPANTYQKIGELSITPVALRHANGVYSSPEWNSPSQVISADWVFFIQDTIAQGHQARDLAQITPEARA